VIVGTLGKALGGYGAYVCGSRELVDFLINSARPFIFSTAPPPATVAAARAALEVLADLPERVERLRANAAALREGLRSEGLEPIGSETQIVPLMIGEADDTMALCERLLAEGVRAGDGRQRSHRDPACLTTMATHRIADLRHAARLIGEAARDLGLTSGASRKVVATPLREAA
jgi:7-keto-8-aminopelargonate synthetase-like enzyme